MGSNNISEMPKKNDYVGNLAQELPWDPIVILQNTRLYKKKQTQGDGENEIFKVCFNHNYLYPCKE